MSLDKNSSTINTELQNFMQKNNTEVVSIFEAITHEDISFVNKYISLKKNLNVFNKFNQTPLHVACINNQTEIAEILIKNGAPIDPRDRWNDTPLFLSINNSLLETSELLIQHGASVNILNNNNYSPLHIAIQAKNSKSAQLLINSGADIHCLDRDNNTPLHLAVNYQHIPTIITLLQAGSDIYRPNFINLSPYSIAESKNNKEIIKIFENYISYKELSSKFNQSQTNQSILIKRIKL